MSASKRYGFLVLCLLCPLTAAAASFETCTPNFALAALNQDNPPIADIHAMLRICDARTPNDVQVLLLHGLLARRSGDYSEAITWLERAREKADDSYTIPALELALTYEWAHQLPVAKGVYQTVLRQQGDSVPARLGLARIALGQNRLPQAIALYTRVLEQDADNLDALNGMGRVMMANKQYPEAKTYFERALRVQNDNRDARLGLSQLAVLMTPATPPVLLSSLPPVPELKPAVEAVVTPPPVCRVSDGLLRVSERPLNATVVRTILTECDAITPNMEAVLRLHGLLDRAQGRYQSAIVWLQKARAVAPTSNTIPALELAVTYEWARQTQQAKQIYQELLAQNPALRPARLGMARVYLTERRRLDAISIYRRLLSENPDDVSALVGMAQAKAVNREFAEAQTYLNKALTIEPDNADAKITQSQLHLAREAFAGASHASSLIVPEKQPSLCDTAKGLVLVNKARFSATVVDRILNHCAKEGRKDAQVLLLRGLLARVQHQYPLAINWLQQARAVASVGERGVITAELALTLEWSGQYQDAKRLYSEMLRDDPGSRVALLGLGRIAVGQYQIPKADRIYHELQRRYPKDVDVLNGTGMLELTDKRFKQARTTFNEALTLQPGNNDALNGLRLLNDSTKYMVSLSEGQYLIEGEHSNSSTVYGYVDLNATDRLIGIATRNTKELQLDLPTNPSILPRTSLFGAFQRQIPERYGWGVNYDYRERSVLPLENRIGANANVYLTPRLQLLGGFWNGMPSPWKNQLYYSSLTWYTNLPFNVTGTGFWTHQEIGGNVATYALDFSKEYSNKAWYDLGGAYIPTERSWQVHGNFIFPIIKNHALEGRYEYYSFNGATIFALGWRIYWL